jgi:hypothetical protein
VGRGRHIVGAALVGFVAVAGADCSGDPSGSNAADPSCTGFGWTGGAGAGCTFAATCPSGKYSLECSTDTGACACVHDGTKGMVVEYQRPFCEAQTAPEAFEAANAACHWNAVAH